MTTKLTHSRRTLLKIASVTGAAMLFPLSRQAIAANRKVTVFMGTTPDFSNVWAGKDKGYFAKENIDAEVRVFPSGAAASDAFRTGEAHFLCCGDIPAIRLWKTTGSRYLAPVSRDFNSPVLVVKSEITRPEDLKGKVIATQTASLFTMMVDLINKKYGLSAQDYRVTNMEPADMVVALAQGSIDGFVWASPFDERAKEASGSKVHVLLRGKDVGFPNSVGLCTRADLIQKDPNLVQAFVRALAAASDWCMANKDQTSAIAAKELHLEPKIARVTQVMNFTTKFDQGLYKFFFALDKYMLDKHLIDKPIDWNQYLDTEFLRNVDPSRVERMASSY